MSCRRPRLRPRARRSSRKASISSRATPTINKAREMFPTKPVKYVVVTHYHDDHSGGLRSYVANDVTIVTTPANQKFFERMASSSFTLNPDDQTRAPHKPRFEFVRDKR